uniref:Uncharacterized protein n=1 Tax=Oryza brachyantha TaxID=4533 RepID=J3N256_ORYBR
MDASSASGSTGDLCKFTTAIALTKSSQVFFKTSGGKKGCPLDEAYGQAGKKGKSGTAEGMRAGSSPGTKSKGWDNPTSNLIDPKEGASGQSTLDVRNHMFTVPKGLEYYFTNPWLVIVACFSP